MVTTFPRLEHDELLYSAVARYSQLECLRKGINFVIGRRLLNNENRVTSVDLPTNLRTISQQLPDSYPETERSLLLKHTMFPALAPLLSRELRAILEKSQLETFPRRHSGGNGTHVVRIMGIRRGLWLCSECAKIELRDLGYAYWHRALQIVPYCSTHSRMACFSANAGDPNLYGYVTADTAYREDKREVTFTNIPFFSELAKDVRYLLEDNDHDTDGCRIRLELANLREQWRAKAPRKLQHAFPESLLNELGNETRQLLETVYGRAISPMSLASACRYTAGGGTLHVPTVLILTRLLNATLPDVLAAAEKMPLQSTKWQCRNSKAACFGTNTIDKFTINNGRAHFFCPKCAVKYARVFPLVEDGNGNFEYEIQTLPQFMRRAWRLRLLRHWMSRQYNVVGLANMFGLGSRGLVAIARETGLPAINGCPADYCPKFNFDDRRNAFRKAVEKAVKNLGNGVRGDLVKRCRRELFWLRRWDPDFLPSVLPPRNGKLKVTLERRRFEKETEALALLDLLVVQIKARRPIMRVTRGALLKGLGLRSYRRADRIRLLWPRAFEKAQSLEERMDQYAERRVRSAFADWVEDCMPTSFQERLNLVRAWRMYRETNIRPARSYWELIGIPEVNSEQQRQSQRVTSIEKAAPWLRAAND
ncbi:MAG: hypothetical protein WAK51_08720 [Opitutaceae bacterium]